MLKKFSMSAVAALTLASAVQAQVEAPREVNQERGRGAQEKEVETRAGNKTIDRTGVVNGAARKDGTTTIPAGQVRTENGVVVAEGNRGDVSQQLSGQLADCILLHNQEEINLARFALEHSQNQKVKDFAQMLINDHQKYGETLQKYAHHHQNQSDQPNRSTDLKSDRRAQPAVSQTQNGERVEVRVGFAGTANSLDEHWYQIEQQSVKNCEQMCRDMLSKEKGADFDKCFVGMQIGAHVGLLAHLQAAESHVTGDFQKVLQDGAQSVKQHLQHAEELKTELMANQK